jgi:signal transduction histidine kinase
VILPQAEVRGVTLTLLVPDAPVLFPTAEDDMHRLLGNLLENAVKYTPSGGEVTVSLTADVSHVKVAVSDTGIGISPEAMPHIFDEFYRASNAKEMGAEGTGLGLSLVKRIVDLYRGEIQVESQPGKGTTFTVLLPRDSEIAADADQPRPNA